MKLSVGTSDHHKLLPWIVLIGAILRLLWLGVSPADLNADEYAKAYNALSLIETGKTFRGLSWPLYFTDFDSSQPSIAIVYNYLVVPSVYLFGLTPWATRLPAALLGTITIPVIFYLADAIFRNRNIAILSAGLLAFSPWHIYLSRWGIEPVSLPVFFLAGYLFLLKGRSKSSYSLLGGICLGCCLYCYPPAIIMVPLFAALFFVTYAQSNGQYQANFMRAMLSALLSTIPLMTLVVSGLDAGSRAKTTSLFSYFGLMKGCAFFGLHLLAVPVVLLALLPLPFLILLGKHCASWRSINKDTDALQQRFLLMLTIISLIPASATFSNNLFYCLFVRGAGMIGIPEMLVASWIVHKYPALLRATWSSFAFWILWMLNSLTLYGAYTAFCDSAFGRQDLGYKEAYQYVAQRASDYQTIVIDVPQNQPFISLLFNSRYPPSRFLLHKVTRKKEDWRLTEIVQQFDKYFFCDWEGCPPITDRTLVLTIPGKHEDLPIIHQVTRHGRPLLLFRESQ